MGDRAPLDPPVTGPSAQVSATAEAALGQVWAVFVAMDLGQVLARGSGPIPAVARTSGQTGPWDVVGSARQVHLADGSVVTEDILASDPTHGAAPSGGQARFAYRVEGFTGPLAALTGQAFGEWTFVEVSADRTLVTWRYRFVPRNGLVAPVLALLIGLFWRAYMRQGIENVRRLAEAAG